jgi:hypothetical protein
MSRSYDLDEIHRAVDAMTEDDLDTIQYNIWPGDNPERNAITRSKQCLKNLLDMKLEETGK